MKNGDYIYANTHADFLNQAFGTNYKAWMSCVWQYNEDTIVWMVRFDKTNRSGWKNSFISDSRIKEENIYNKSEWNRAPVAKPLFFKRIVVEVVDNCKPRKYIFRGIYRYDEQNSNPLTVRYHDKLSNEF